MPERERDLCPSEAVDVMSPKDVARERTPGRPDREEQTHEGSRRTDDRDHASSRVGGEPVVESMPGGV